jgi:superfamily II DNA/RNA helicase
LTAQTKTSKDIKEDPEMEEEYCLPIKGLVVSPTREIAIQLHQYWCLLTKDLPEFESSLLIGGLDPKQQRREILVKKPSLIFGTVGRLLETTKDKSWLNLNTLQCLVIDEADKMATKVDSGQEWNSFGTICD